MKPGDKIETTRAWERDGGAYETGVFLKAHGLGLIVVKRTGKKNPEKWHKSFWKKAS